jgi:hypothetical protein
MFGFAMFLYLAGFGALLFDALQGVNYSLGIALFGGILIAGAMAFFVGALLSGKRIHSESKDSLP